MRGDFAPLADIVALAERYDRQVAENVLVVVDDSHGVGAAGITGRGSEEVTGCPPVDLLVGTLGKAFGVNGGYLAADQTLIDYLRERSPLYIYSNPITPGEAAAAAAALSLVDSQHGRERLAQLGASTARFEQGLCELGFATIPGPHPIVPLLARDTATTSALVEHLYRAGVLATGLRYPVVPRGDDTVRFQLSAEHTDADLDQALAALAKFQQP